MNCKVQFLLKSQILVIIGEINLCQKAEKSFHYDTNKFKQTT